jgi:hypothetical protein
VIRDIRRNIAGDPLLEQRFEPLALADLKGSAPRTTTASKDDHHMRRNYLKGPEGDRADAVLAARLQLQPPPALAAPVFPRPFVPSLS